MAEAAAELIIDVTRALDRALQGRLPTGVDRVGQEYIRRYGAQALALVRFAGRWVVLGHGASQEVFGALLDPAALNAGRMRRLVAGAYLFNWRVPARGCLLLNMGHSGLDDARYGAHVRRCGWRGLYFLHDLIPLTHPEYCRPGEADKHRQRLLTMLGSGSGVLVNSQATAQELERFARQEGLPVPALAVAPLAPGRMALAASARPLDGPYFVMLGTIEPRKNHLLLLQLWRDWALHLGAATPRLVVIGQRGWECEQVLDMLERCPALQGVVLELARCSDAELATWLAHAQALLFPSFAEGFGMPLVEALCMGVPVLASDLAAFREVAGDVPEYLSPLDGLGWMQAVEHYAQPDAERRRAQLERMQSWQAPTWEAHFEEADALLRQCLEQNGRVAQGRSQ